MNFKEHFQFLKTPESLGFFLLPLIIYPGFQSAYLSPKWFFLYTLLPVFAIRYLKSDSKKNPQWEVRTWALMGLLVLSFLFNTIYHQTFLTEDFFVHRLLFVALLAMSLLRFQGEIPPVWLQANQWATFLVIVYGAYQFSICRFVVFNPDPNCFPSSLGNINMTAQFLSFSVLLQLEHLSRIKGEKLKSLLLFLLGSSFVFLYFSYCRSSWISFFIILSIGIFRKWPISRTSWVNLILISGFICFFVERYTPIPTVDHQMKIQSSNIRLELWGESLKLVRDNPMGLGTGNFEFGAIPWIWEGETGLNEDQLARSPHNFFLRVLSEEGWLYFILLMAVSLFVLRPFRQFQESVKGPSSPLPFLILLVAGVEAFFQFPFENPYPVFFLALMSPFYWWKFDLQRTDFSFKTGRLGMATFLFLCFILVSIKAGGLIVKNHISENLSLMEKYCQLTPGDWKLCLTKVQKQILKAPEKVEESLKLELEKRPWNVVAMGYLGVFRYQKGERDKACTILGLRDALWRGRSDYHDFVIQDCSLAGFSDPILAYADWYQAEGLRSRSGKVRKP